jgi:hypothetical protein
MPPFMKELAQDGYIFVIQNLRGRFKSEGVFNLSSWVDPTDPKATNETTDAYDSIDWLVKNVPNNNGNVGIFGVSYDGLTAALTLLHPHPALKAISEQASPVDQWMNDDDHRYGALRESYDFEYAVMEQADKNKNTYFTFETYDTYQWYLDLGPLSNINAKYLHGSIPYWNSTVEHPDYDAFWKKEAWVNQLHSSTVPNLNVAGFWDQEDPWGPWQIFRHAEQNDPQHTNFMVAGPWYHGEWWSPKGDTIGLIPFSGHETAREFRENIEAPFFRYYLHGKGEKPAWQASTFQSGSNTWHTYAAWPPKEAKPTKLYLHADGTLSFTAPVSTPKTAPAAAALPAQTAKPYRADILLHNPIMKRHVLIFGLVGGLLIATLQYTEYRFVVIEHSVELYSALVAILFAAFGIWLGLRITRRRETIRETVVVREVLVPAEAPPPSNPSLPIRPASRPSASRHASSKSSPWSPAASAIARSPRSFSFPKTPSRHTVPAPSTSSEPPAAPRPSSAAKNWASCRDRVYPGMPGSPGRAAPRVRRQVSPPFRGWDRVTRKHDFRSIP